MGCTRRQLGWTGRQPFTWLCPLQAKLHPVGRPLNTDEYLFMVEREGKEFSRWCCPYCSYSSANKGNFNRHLRRHLDKFALEMKKAKKSNKIEIVNHSDDMLLSRLNSQLDESTQEDDVDEEATSVVESQEYSLLKDTNSISNDNYPYSDTLRTLRRSPRKRLSNDRESTAESGTSQAVAAGEIVMMRDDTLVHVDITEPVVSEECMGTVESITVELHSSVQNFEDEFHVYDNSPSPENIGKIKPTNYVCDVCGITFKTRYGLTVHTKNIHTLQFKHICSECGVGYNQFKQYSSHMRVHRKEHWPACGLCRKEFPASELREHVHVCRQQQEAKMGGASLICSDCGDKFAYPSGLKEHTEGKHSKRLYVCKQCGKSFKWRSSLKAHSKVTGHSFQAASTPVGCESTPVGCEDLKSSQSHLAGPLNMDEYRFMVECEGKEFTRWCCPYCSYSSGNKGLFIRHLRKHLDKFALEHSDDTLLSRLNSQLDESTQEDDVDEEATSVVELQESSLLKDTDSISNENYPSSDTLRTLRRSPRKRLSNDRESTVEPGTSQAVVAIDNVFGTSVNANPTAEPGTFYDVNSRDSVFGTPVNANPTAERGTSLDVISRDSVFGKSVNADSTITGSSNVKRELSSDVVPKESFVVPRQVMVKNTLASKDMMRDDTLVYVDITEPIVTEECMRTVESIVTVESHPNVQTLEDELPSLENIDKIKPVNFVCDVCGITFKSRFGLSVHTRNIHTLQFKHICPECGVGFNRFKQYSFHMRVHRKEHLPACGLCRKEFPASELREHVHVCRQQQEAKMGGASLICSDCGDKFAYPSGLKEHTEGKHSKRSFVCKQCGKSFKWRTSLKAHSKVTGHSPFESEVTLE